MLPRKSRGLQEFISYVSRAVAEPIGQPRKGKTERLRVFRSCPLITPKDPCSSLHCLVSMLVHRASHSEGGAAGRRGEFFVRSRFRLKEIRFAVQHSAGSCAGTLWSLPIHLSIFRCGGQRDQSPVDGAGFASHVAGETSLLARAGNFRGNFAKSMKRRLRNGSIRAFVALLSQSAADRRAGPSIKWFSAECRHETSAHTASRYSRSSSLLAGRSRGGHTFP